MVNFIQSADSNIKINEDVSYLLLALSPLKVLFCV